MRLLSAILSRLALGLLLLGSVGMIVSMLLGVADVVGTSFLGTPVPGTLEVTESTMVLIVFGALAYAQERRGHIRVELLYARAGPRARSIMDAVTHIVAFAFFALVAWQAIGEFLYSWEMKEATMGTVRFPLYPARLLLAIGTGLVLLRLALDVIADLVRVWHAEPPPAPVAVQSAQD
jgi:TRAP-type C4-dicarboxylate transport system permease small subunit